MRALVAMSGGVDSSVAAALLVEAGHEVVGVTMKQWEGANGSLPTSGCCTVADAMDARRVAAQLGIPYYVLDYVGPFTEAVVEPFTRAYLEGKTPNPCVECNRRIRFSTFLGRTEALGCEVLATGHHARVRRDHEGWHLLQGHDKAKDQSYVLHMLGQAELGRIVFPVGEMTKAAVRDRATALGLRSADKPDSQDLCFVAGDYRDFLRERVPEVTAPGPVLDRDGTVLGSHDGTFGFTIGQRRGLGIAVGEPRYVVDIRPEERTVVVGSRDDLLVHGCTVAEATFVSGSAPAGRSIEVKVRYRAAPVAATLTSRDGRTWQVGFSEPQVGVAPGQFAVFYRDEEVLGGGTIVAPHREPGNERPDTHHEVNRPREGT